MRKTNRKSNERTENRKWSRTGYGEGAQKRKKKNKGQSETECFKGHMQGNAGYSKLPEVPGVAALRCEDGVSVPWCCRVSGCALGMVAERAVARLSEAASAVSAPESMRDELC